MVTREGRGFARIAGKQFEETLETLVEMERFGKLPQNGTEFFLEAEHARGEEVSECRFHVAESLHVRDEAAALDGENEVFGRLALAISRRARALQRVERTVDFDRIEAFAANVSSSAWRRPFG